MSLLASLQHLLVPAHTNNHKAKIIHHSGLSLLILSFVVFQMGINFLGAKGQVLGYAANISVEEIVRLTNQKRAEAGVGPVTVNPSLSQAASAKGAHMLLLGYWAHVAPDGTQPWKFFADVNYRYRYAGENLARDFSSSSAAVDAWMASPTHRENMLAAKYKEIGIGVVEGDLGGSNTTVIVQLFGTKLNDDVAGVVDAKEVTLATPIASPRAIALKTPVPNENLVTPNPYSITQATEQEPTVLISPFVTTRSFSLILIGLLLVVFVVDIVVVSRRRITRVSGRNWAHLSFLGMLLVVVIIMRAGQII